MDFREQQRVAASIRADMQKAYKIIADGKTRYIKDKLKARSKKQAEETAALFAELEPYESKQQIQDAYGWAEIPSLSEMDRLMNLWDMREQHAKDGKVFRDRVVDMLEKAIAHIDDEYQDFLEEADHEATQNARNQVGGF
jgi:hypothetical protein